MKKSENITPGELVKKHIKDPNHVITDDELANVKVGEEGETDSEFKKEIADKEEELENLNHKKDGTSSYDILDI
jgi:hypothetical protein